MIRTFLPALAIAGLIAAPSVTGMAFAADTKPAPAKPAAAAASTAAKPADTAKPAVKKHKHHKAAAAPASK
jgi:hypothetical protein